MYMFCSRIAFPFLDDVPAEENENNSWYPVEVRAERSRVVPFPVRLKVWSPRTNHQGITKRFFGSPLWNKNKPLENVSGVHAGWVYVLCFSSPECPLRGAYTVVYEVLTAVIDNISFWDVTSCSRVYVHRRFGGICCLHLQGIKVKYFTTLKMGTAGSSKTLVNIYHTLYSHISEESNLQNIHGSYNWKTMSVSLHVLAYSRTT
jgi:hypothetical protein